MEKAGISKYTNTHKIDENTYILWNSFFPSSLIKLDKIGFQFIEGMRKCEFIEIDDNNRDTINFLIDNNILFKGTVDTYKDQFVTEVRTWFEKKEKEIIDSYDNKCVYSYFQVSNDRCNLCCSYCINRYKNPYSPIPVRFEERFELLKKAIDQFISAKLRNDENSAEISFSGGEILLEWKIIRSIVERISKKYPEMDVTFSLITNMTLMTKEIAEFLDMHKFEVSVSIDGYGNSHNKTRAYFDDSGSFRDVVKGIDVFRKYNKNSPLKKFQGTVEHVDDFDPIEVYKMAVFGFTSATLSPNLLNVSEKDALKKAELMGRFFYLNSNSKFKVYPILFRELKELINQKEFKFSFLCRGLGNSNTLGLTFNVDTLRISQICSYLQSATLPFNELDYNIFNHTLFKLSAVFLKNRIEAFLENCIPCQLVGFCRGGCILSGLDKENQPNKAACVYLKQMWITFLNRRFASS